MARTSGLTLLVAVMLAAACQVGPGRAAAPSTHRSMSYQEFQDGIERAGIWSGGPEENRESVGRHSLAKAIEHGLMPDDKLLDIGAGSLRVGWWFLHYIEPDNYYAIEPVEERIDGAAALLDIEINAYHNMDFEFPDQKFDFVFARSIWTHASKPMISKMLSEFLENSAPDAKFLTSVLFASTPDEDYAGTEWVGRVQKEDKAGFARHSREWIEDECERLGLNVEEVGVLHKQTWLLIERK